MNSRNNIGVQIALIIGIVEILAMIALFVVMSLNLTGILEDKAIRDLNVIAKDRAAIVETYIDGCVNFLDAYSKASENREALLHPEDKEAVEKSRAFTNQVAKERTDLEGLYIADYSTYVLSHINPDSVDKTFRDPASAKELEDLIRKESHAFCTGIVLAPVSKRMVIPVYAPVYDEQNRSIGFAGAAFFADALNRRFTGLSEYSGQNIAYSLLDASSGVYIFDRDPSLVGKECLDPDIVNAMEALHTGSAEEETISLVKNNTVTSCYYMVDRDWVFVVRDSGRDVFSVIPDIRNRIILTCFLITVIMILVCAYSVTYKLRPLKDIKSTIERLKANDFSRNHVIEEYRLREDEIGTISNAVTDLHDVLESRQELFLEMLESLSVGTLILNAETEDILLINHTALELFGFSDSDRSGLRIEDVRSHFDAEENAYIKEQLDRVRRSDDEITFEEKVNRDDNRKHTLLAQAKGAVLSDKTRVIILTLKDISYREGK